MRDHSKLRAFELGGSVLQSRPTRKPGSCRKDELFGLTSQMRRAAVSVASNIVEGCSRTSTTEYVRFLEIAYGSARELEYQISLSVKLGYLTDVHDFAAMAPETCKVLNGLIRSLRSTQ